MISRTSKPWWKHTVHQCQCEQGLYLNFSCHADEVLQQRPAPESGWAGEPPSWPAHSAAWQGSSSRCRWPSHAAQRWSGCRMSCPSSASHRLWERKGDNGWIQLSLSQQGAVVLNLQRGAIKHLHKKENIWLLNQFCNNCKMSWPLISMKRLKNRMGLREKKWAMSFIPTLKGFRSSSFRCVCTERRRSFSISLHSLSSRCCSMTWRMILSFQGCVCLYLINLGICLFYLVEHVHDFFVVAMQ